MFSVKRLHEKKVMSADNKVSSFIVGPDKKFVPYGFGSRTFIE